jgi:hypothetical protein
MEEHLAFFFMVYQFCNNLYLNEKEWEKNLWRNSLCWKLLGSGFFYIVYFSSELSRKG